MVDAARPDTNATGRIDLSFSLSPCVDFGAMITYLFASL